MKKACIIYGSSTGTCEGIAQTIAGKLGIDDVMDASSISADAIAEYEVLLLGSSTWGDGELQDDWYDAVNVVKEVAAGKTIALFGCGDSESYCDTFCDAMGIIYEELQGTGATFVGGISAEGYSHSNSKAVIDGNFIGCACDEVNEGHKTEARIDAWIESIQASL